MRKVRIPQADIQKQIDLRQAVEDTEDSGDTAALDKALDDLLGHSLELFARHPDVRSGQYTLGTGEEKPLIPPAVLKRKPAQ
jgi:hypothetical protein